MRQDWALIRLSGVSTDFGYKSLISTSLSAHRDDIHELDKRGLYTHYSLFKYHMLPIPQRLVSASLIPRDSSWSQLIVMGNYLQERGHLIRQVIVARSVVSRRMVLVPKQRLVFPGYHPRIQVRLKPSNFSPIDVRRIEYCRGQDVHIGSVFGCFVSINSATDFNKGCLNYESAVENGWPVGDGSSVRIEGFSILMFMLAWGIRLQRCYTSNSPSMILHSAWD